MSAVVLDTETTGKNEPIVPVEIATVEIVSLEPFCCGTRTVERFDPLYGDRKSVV